MSAETRLAQGAVEGVVLYDGQCGFCSRWVKYWAETLRRRGFEIASLDEPWVAERVKMPHEELLTDIRLLTADGQLISGADVYLYVMRRIWWASTNLVGVAALRNFQFARVQPADPRGLPVVCAKSVLRLARMQVVAALIAANPELDAILGGHEGEAVSTSLFCPRIGLFWRSSAAGPRFYAGFQGGTILETA